ncbi:MAG: hypothetical protein AAFV53_30380 [Myxococcota bacterium]
MNQTTQNDEFNSGRIARIIREEVWEAIQYGKGTAEIADEAGITPRRLRRIALGRAVVGRMQAKQILVACRAPLRRFQEVDLLFDYAEMSYRKSRGHKSVERERRVMKKQLKEAVRARVCSSISLSAAK